VIGEREDQLGWFWGDVWKGIEVGPVGELKE